MKTTPSANPLLQSMLRSPHHDPLRPLSDATGFSPTGRVGSLSVNNKLGGGMKRLSLIVALSTTALIACGESQPSTRAITTTQSETQIASPAQHLFDPRMISIMVVGPEDELGVNPEADYRFVAVLTNNSSMSVASLRGLVSIRSNGSDVLVNHPFVVSETLPPNRPVRTVLSVPVPDRVGRTSEIHVEVTTAERE